MTLIKTALAHRAGVFVNPPAGFLGVNGIRKLAKELPGWEKELGTIMTDYILEGRAYSERAGIILQHIASLEYDANVLLLEGIETI